MPCLGSSLLITLPPSIACPSSQHLFGRLTVMESVVGTCTRSELYIGAVADWSPNSSCRSSSMVSDVRLGLAQCFSSRCKIYKSIQRRSCICHCSHTNLVGYEQKQSSQPDDLQDFKKFSSIALQEFKMSDFELCTNVSVGLAGKGNDVVFEAIVRNPASPLLGSKVVLRQLAGARAQRWRKHALQVITKLLRQVMLYKSYAVQIYGYILPCGVDKNTLTVVHGYYDNYSLHHWLLCEDWVPSLESRLALNEDCGRRVGDDRVGGPAVSRQLRLVQILIRDLLIGVNYLHSHGFAHTELELHNVQISHTDRHVKVGLLGNATRFEDNHEKNESRKKRRKVNRRQLMIAYDIRCVGIMMARMVLRELMDPSIFARFKDFLKKGNDPAGLREFMMVLLDKRSPGDNIGFQILDRNRGAGWNLLSLMLASKPSDRLSCTEALRHRFLCGPKWRVESSISMTRWGIGFTAVRIIEEYIYGSQQRNRLTQLIHVLELLNPNPTPEEWAKSLPGKWKLLYHTGRHIGLSLRQASPAVLIGDVFYEFNLLEDRMSMTARTTFSSMLETADWMLDKKGIQGKFEVSCTNISIQKGERVYNSELDDRRNLSDRLAENIYSRIRNKGSIFHEERKLHESLSLASATTLPVVRLNIQDIEMTMQLDYVGEDTSYPIRCLQEVRKQIPSESFDISELVCGTYVDARLLVLRGISGAALIFVRSGWNH